MDFSQRLAHVNSDSPALPQMVISIMFTASSVSYYVLGEAWLGSQLPVWLGVHDKPSEFFPGTVDYVGQVIDLHVDFSRRLAH